MVRKIIKLALSSLVLVGALTYSAPEAMANPNQYCFEGTAIYCMFICGMDAQITEQCVTIDDETDCDCCCVFDQDT